MTNGPQFSIVTPTWNRLDGRLERCLLSVATQTHRDYEHIVVDDGSKDGTWDYLERLVIYGWNVTPVRIEHQGRVIARNEGMRKARGAYLVWLDSDDSLDATYLEAFSYWIEREPEVDVWVTGAVVHGMEKGPEFDRCDGHGPPTWTKLRYPWVPEKGQLFNSGHVGTGMFVFRRSCLDTIGLLPPWKNHNAIADGIDEYLGLPPGTTGYGSAGKKGGRPKGHVGDPFGDDHVAYQALCLHYEARILAPPGRKDPPCLYIHYKR